MKMEVAMDEVLKSIGWETGFHLPVANDENKALEREMAMLLMKKAKMTKEFDDVTAKCYNLQNHLKYVVQETKQNQSLLNAYKEQMESQHHKYKLTMAEKENVNSEIRRIKKEVEETENRQQIRKADLAKTMQRLEKINAEASWDAEAMRAWEESLKKRDEDNELLKKFSTEDQRKMTEMEAKRESLQLEVFAKREMLEKMHMEIANSEQVMTRTGKIVKQMREERSALVRQWQEAVKNMRQRDYAIKRANTEIDHAQDVLSQKEEQLLEQNEFLENEIRNNKMLDLEIEEGSVQNSKIRRDIIEITQEVLLLQSEADIKKNIVENKAHELEKERMKLKNIKLDIEERCLTAGTLVDEVKKLREKLNEAKENTLTAEERSKELERLIANSEQIGRNYQFDIDSVHGVFQRNTQILAEVKAYGAVKESEVQGAQSTLVIIRKRLEKENKELIHQKEILSDLEMKVACVEAKIGNLEGESQVEDDIKKWNSRIIDLEESLAKHNEVKALLNSQILTLQKETLRLVSSLSGDSDRLQSLKDKLQGLLLMYEGGIKQMAAAKLRTQQKQVEENVLKLKVDKLNRAMGKANTEIYNLQKYRMELETVMKERHIEIQTAREVLLAKRRNIDEDRGRLKADIAIRKVRIAQLQNKYDLAIGLLGKDDSGAPLSMAHFKIKAAQEKYMLQQEGDDLDQKVRKAESEIVAMENTLKIVNTTNNSFRQSLETVGEDTEDAQKLKELEFNFKDRNILLREKKKLLIMKQDTLKELVDTLKEIEQTRDDSKEVLYGKQDLFAKLEREEQGRQEKIDRADRHILSCKKNIRKDRMEIYDRELYIRQLQDTSKNIIHQLADFAQQFQEVNPNMKKYFAEHHMDMPTVRASMTTVSSDSVNSPSSSSSSVPCNVTSLELTFQGPMSASRRSLGSEKGKKF